MAETVVRSNHGFYKGYSGVMLTIIALLLAAILVVMIVGGIKLDHAIRSADSQFSGFDKNVQSISNSLKNYSSQTPSVQLGR